MNASPRGVEADLESVWSGSGGPLCNSRNSAMSRLLLSDSSSSNGAGCNCTDVAEASSVRLSPDRLDKVSLLLIAPFWLGRASFSDLISFLNDSPWEIPIKRGLLSQTGAPSFTPARTYGSYGCGPWSGTAHSFRSLIRGCWDPPPNQSSLKEENVHLEVDTFHFMVRRSPARPSLLPDWYSAGVPAGPILCRADHSTLNVYVAAKSAYHASLGGQSVGRHPLVTFFLHGMLRLRLPVRSRIPSWDLAVVLEALCRPTLVEEEEEFAQSYRV